MPVDHYTRAGTCTDDHTKHHLRPCPRTIDGLGQGESICVIGDTHLAIKKSLYILFERLSVQASLAEIASLMKMRDDPMNSKAEIRERAVNKLKEIEVNLEELETLRGELKLPLNLCNCSEDGCPIIENLDAQT